MTDPEYDLASAGGWEQYSEVADIAMDLATVENREVIVKWSDYVKPYKKKDELVPVHYFKFNPAMTELHIRSQYLNLELSEEFRAVWPPLKEQI